MSQFVIVALRVVVAAYLTLFLVHSVLELVYAWRSTRSRRDRSTEAAGLTRWPDVDVVVPCFNEDPVLLDACCRSLARQDYPGRLRVWLADDGSRNLDMLRPVYRRYEGGDWSVILMPRNTGKREAQDAAVRQGDGELVLMMDSDTVIAPRRDPPGGRRVRQSSRRCAVGEDPRPERLGEPADAADPPSLPAQVRG
jgi:N-acetylglucosaminyltransferase